MKEAPGQEPPFSLDDAGVTDNPAAPNRSEESQQQADA